MSELKPRITENGIDYILVGDYYIPDLKLPEEQFRRLPYRGEYRAGCSLERSAGSAVRPRRRAAAILPDPRPY